MSLSHAVIWIDHQEAHVIHFNADAAYSGELEHLKRMLC